jgi:putative toxin-antitoxin system antitoxin component (TIGR02293 family)
MGINETVQTSRKEDRNMLNTHQFELDSATRRVLIEARAHQIFGDRDKAQGWLDRPSFVLKGQIPNQLVETRAGFESVMNRLRRVHSGIPAQ